MGVQICHKFPCWHNQDIPGLEFKISRVENARQGYGIKLSLTFPGCGLEIIFRAQELNFAGQEQLNSTQFLNLKEPFFLLCKGWTC
jgi:hypothetical protein